MELAGEEPAVVGQLDGLDQFFSSGRAPADFQSGSLKAVDVVVVDFVTVAVTLDDMLGTINAGSQRAGFEHAFLSAKAHGAAEVGVFVTGFDLAVVVDPLVNQRHDREVGLDIKLGRVGARHAGHVPCVFDQRHLHAKADAQVRNVVLACVADGLDLAFDTALAKAARHEDGIHALECGTPVTLDFFGVDVMDVDFAAGVNAGVLEGFGQ